MPLILDSSKQGLEMFFKPWQIETLKVLWKNPEGAGSATVYKQVKTVTQISRASVINYLNAMVDENILNYTEVTGKGGHYRIYRLEESETELKQHLITLFLSKLLEEHPEATKKVITEIDSLNY